MLKHFLEREQILFHWYNIDYVSAPFTGNMTLSASDTQSNNTTVSDKYFQEQ